MSFSAAVPAPFRRRDFVRLLLGKPFYLMLALLVLQAALAATGTALIIKAAQDVANEEFLVMDFVWIVLAQSLSYLVGASSWVFAERAGFGAFGRYMAEFARSNRGRAHLLGDKDAREQVEPFLTNETFHLLFELVYELEADLRLLFGLVFNVIVLGAAIDAGLPWVYALVFAILLVLQWLLRRPVSAAYLGQQRATNRMTAHTYTAWDNVFAGNRYNYRLWNAGYKQRLRDALVATIRAILAREGLAAVGGIIVLAVVFAYLAVVAARSVTDTALLVALAATLPRQIEMSTDVHGLASGWNDLLAIWTRMGGACEAMRPAGDPGFESRIDFTGLQLSGEGGEPVPAASVDAALAQVAARVQAGRGGRILVRGRNGAGKSTLLAALKARLGANAFYWPTTDRLSFAFARRAREQAEAEQADQDGELDEGAIEEAIVWPAGFSSGERQLRSLEEIVRQSRAQVYLLDEWDANLDTRNRAGAEALVRQLAERAVVVEISHRDRA